MLGDMCQSYSSTGRVHEYNMHSPREQVIRLLRATPNLTLNSATPPTNRSCSPRWTRCWFCCTPCSCLRSVTAAPLPPRLPAQAPRPRQAPWAPWLRAGATQRPAVDSGWRRTWQPPVWWASWAPMCLWAAQGRMGRRRRRRGHGSDKRRGAGGRRAGGERVAAAAAAAVAGLLRRSGRRRNADYKMPR